MTLYGTFYLKSGAIIEEEMLFDDKTTRNEFSEIYKALIDGIEKGMSTDNGGTVTFGYTVFKFSEIVAVKFSECN